MTRTQKTLFSTCSCVSRSLDSAPLTRNLSIRNGANERGGPVTLVQRRPQPTIVLQFRLVPDFLAHTVTQVARGRCQALTISDGPRRGFKFDRSKLDGSCAARQMRHIRLVTITLQAIIYDIYSDLQRLVSIFPVGYHTTLPIVFMALQDHCRAHQF